MNQSESIAALAAAFGGEWMEHYKAKGYFFNRHGLAASFQKGKYKLIIGCHAGQMKYRAITWNDCGILRRVYIHRAVCELFNGDCPEGMECRHLNGNNTDNRAENLAWGTSQDNLADKYRHGTTPVGEKNPMAKLTVAQVLRMRGMRSIVNLPYYKIAPMFGVSTMTAFRAITGVSWKTI